LWVFQEKTGNQTKVLSLARRWPRQTLWAYCEELRRVQMRLTELEHAFEQLIAGTAASQDLPPQSDPAGAHGSACDGHATDHESTASDDVSEMQRSAHAMGESCTAETPPGLHGSGHQPVNVTNVVADAQPTGTHDASTTTSMDDETRMAFIDTTEAETEVAQASVHRALEGNRSLIAEERATSGTPDLPLDADAAEALTQAIEPVITLLVEGSQLTGGSSDHRMDLLERIRACRATGCSWRALAKQSNAERVPTLSDKRVWDGSMLARFARNMSRT
jgi:hypothetical protein